MLNHELLSSKLFIKQEIEVNGEINSYLRLRKFAIKNPGLSVFNFIIIIVVPA